MKILHISDTHFHHGDENNVGVLGRIEKLKMYSDHVVVITGDITDDGRPDQREKAREAIKLLNAIVVPGNHDYGAMGSIYDVEDANAFDEFASLFNCGPFFNKIPQQIKIDNVLFILLNSCLETESPFDFACGSIGRKQLGYLNKILNDPVNGGFIKVVALHHHPFIHSDPTMQLLDANRFIRTIYGKVDVLLFGHKHVEQQWINKSGCRFIIAAGALSESGDVSEIVIDGSDIEIRHFC